MSESAYITKETLHRLLQDVKEIMKNPLDSQGIYYVHDESDMLKGYALIIGPKETPYQYGYYFFRIEYPYDYPHRPPTVKYLTNDGSTRFHPNLYRNGKVCLSILNTWKGDQWSSCQSISSILLTIVSVMDANPICNEPGFSTTSRECIPYNKCIQYKNFDIAIKGILNSKYAPPEYKHFADIVSENFANNKKAIIELVTKYANTKRENGKFSVGVYNMSVDADYSRLVKELTNIKV